MEANTIGIEILPQVSRSQFPDIKRSKETLIKPSLSGDICLVLANETTMCRF